MTEHIERDALLSEIMIMRNQHLLSKCDGAKVERMARQIPAADVAPVMHGRWETKIKGKPSDGGTYGINVCSVCKHAQHVSAKGNYCPNCGAKMDGEGETDGT